MRCFLCPGPTLQSLLGLEENYAGQKSKATCKLRAKSSQRERRSQAQKVAREPGETLHSGVPEGGAQEERQPESLHRTIQQSWGLKFLLNKKLGPASADL